MRETWLQLSQIRGTDHRGHKVVESRKAFFAQEIETHCERDHNDGRKDDLHDGEPPTGILLFFLVVDGAAGFHNNGTSSSAMTVPPAKNAAMGTG